jgi:hemoglobin
MSEKPALPIPYDQIGGEAPVRALVERFYDAMEEHEPELAALHAMEHGKISRTARDRFASFLIGWLGGPQEYVRLHGHPRLRMRHAHVPVNLAMRDAWLRSMQRALEHPSISADVRSFLTAKFADLANFLRNQGD